MSVALYTVSVCFPLKSCSLHMEIPTSIQELRICNATVDDVDYLSQKLGEAISVEKIIIFVSCGKKYYVVASIIKILENDLDFGVLPIYTWLKGQKK